MTAILAALLAPQPNWTVECLSGNTYTSDKNCLITGGISNLNGITNPTSQPSGNTSALNTGTPFTGIQQGDVLNLHAAGCITIPDNLIGILIGANMNSTADQQFVLVGNAYTRYQIVKIVATNASTSLTTAAGGIYPAASKGGTAIVAAGQAYSSLTTSAIALNLTLAGSTVVYAAGSNPYLSLTTAQGAAATADFYLYGDPML